MKIQTIWKSCIVMTMFTACQQSEQESMDCNDLPLSIVASIESPKNTWGSRYAGDDPSSVQFENPDSIGVFIDEASALKWVYGNFGLKLSRYANGVSSLHGVVSRRMWRSLWPDKTEEHTFCAYYPYSVATSTASVPMPSLLGQTGTITSISRCDFLVASVTQSYGTDGVVQFQGNHAFTHVSTLLQLNLKGDGDLSASTIQRITITGAGIVAPSTFSFVDQSVTLAPNEQSDVLEAVVSHEMAGADHSFYFIVNEKTDGETPVTLTVEYTTGDKTYVATLDNFANNTFEGGMRQRYTLTIKDSALIISGSSISAWGEGEQMDDVVINGEEQSL